MRLGLRALESMTTESKKMLSLKTVEMTQAYIPSIQEVLTECIKKVGSLLHLPGPF
jgi:hypothetical protein